MNTRLRLTLAVTLVCCGAAEAHHSIAGMYDEGHPVTLDGSVLEFHFVNPHPFVLLKANDQTWKLELDNRWELTDVGVTAATLKPGDRVVVIGSPGRDKSAQLYVWRLERPADGFLYEQVGTSPRVSWVRR